MNKKYVIIHPPSLDYNYMFQRPQQMMRAFAKLGHTVYYCQQHLEEGRCTETVEDNLHIVYDLKELPTKCDFLWTGNPMLFKTVEDYNAKVLVYDCCDDFHDFWRDREDVITKKADVVIVTAANILDRKLKEKDKDRVYLVQNGVDTEMFDITKKHSIPRDIRTNLPILGYTGALADWVDWDLISKTADLLPFWNIALIGPELCIIPDSIREKKNIHVLEMKDYTELPQYVSYFDVCMIPFKINKITQATNPVKLYEYLSLGKPVVTTDMKELKSFKDVIYTSNAKKFAATVKKACMDNSEELVLKRIQRVQNETWDNRAKQSLEIMEKFYNV